MAISKKIAIFLIVLSMVVLTGCPSPANYKPGSHRADGGSYGDPSTYDKTTGAGAGALLMGFIGAVVNDDDRKKGFRNGAIMGAIAGTIGGAFNISRYEAEQARLEAAGYRTHLNRATKTLQVVMEDNQGFFFARNQCEPSSYNGINTIIETANALGAGVELHGYTDDTGSSQYNQKLSECRVGSIARALDGKVNVLGGQGHGENNLVYFPGSKKVNRPASRRVVATFRPMQ